MCRGEIFWKINKRAGEKFLRAGENKHADNGRMVLPSSTTPKKQYVFALGLAS